MYTYYSGDIYLHKHIHIKFMKEKEKNVLMLIWGVANHLNGFSSLFLNLTLIAYDNYKTVLNFY